MAEYKLHCFAQSGNAYKPALMLSLAGADWESVFVDFFNGVTRGDEYRGSTNEMGEAPVLEHAGKSMSQSGAILHYLVKRLNRFGGKTEEEEIEILRWILFDNHKFTSYIATYRFLTHFMKTGETPVTEFFKARMMAAIAVLEKRLTGRKFVATDELTIADISLCGYLFMEDEFGVSWSDNPAIGAWLERVKSQAGWQHPYEMMPGHPLPSKT
jgi:glutathione S-transferase